MKKLSIKDIIKFRNRTERGKKNFALDLKIDKKKNNTEGGGDYWITCISAISNSYRLNDIQPIIDKRDELIKKYGETDYIRTKLMYKRNIDILANYINFDSKKIRPTKKIKFIKKNKDNSILTIKGFQVQVDPHHVFTFEKDDTTELGAIWFIAQLESLKQDELGMFNDILYKYLHIHFSKEYSINTKFCLVVDVSSNTTVNYSQLEKGKIQAILDTTLNEIKKML